MDLYTALTQDPLVQVLDVKNFQADGRVTNQDQLEQTAKKKSYNIYITYCSTHLSYNNDRYTLGTCNSNETSYTAYSNSCNSNETSCTAYSNSSQLLVPNTVTYFSHFQDISDF